MLGKMARLQGLSRSLTPSRLFMPMLYKGKVPLIERLKQENISSQIAYMPSLALFHSQQDAL